LSGRENEAKEEKEVKEVKDWSKVASGEWLVASGESKRDSSLRRLRSE